MLQNHLKAIFVDIYMTGNIVLFLVAVYKLMYESHSLAWAGTAIASGAVTGLFGLYYAGRLPRTSRHIPLLLVLTLLGTVLAGIGFAYGGWDSTSGIPFVLALTLSLIGTLAYLYWYSYLERAATSTLRVGETLPTFTLLDTGGNPVSIESLRGKPVLMVFYRGNWCPLCMAQVRELADQCHAFLLRGITVALVSPQPQSKSAALAKRMDVPFQFLTDPGGQAARKLGIEHQAGLPLGLQVFGYDTNTVFPTLIVIDQNGKIVFVDQTENYRVRPELDVVLGRVAALSGASRIREAFL